MFGVALSTATRAEMREAIRGEGLKPQREDDAFQEDIYEALNWMPGLLQMKFSYAAQGQRLARVDYVFMTFSDNAHVEDVKLRIEGRFGRPQSVTGREQSGPYQAVWRLPDQMEIFVAREWPQKTTQLRFTNLPVWGQMRPDSTRENGQPIRRERNQNNQALPMWVSSRSWRRLESGPTWWWGHRQEVWWPRFTPVARTEPSCSRLPPTWRTPC
jgi:hypothetical protein